MSKTIDISVENNETDVIIVSLERVGVEARVGNVERSITVDFGSLPQNIYWDEILDKPNFHPVATSGDYDDLENKPNLHAVATSGDYDDLENKPNLSGVATSGNYADLSGKPRINSVTLNGNKTSAQLGLATAAQGALADSAYQKPLDGIPASDMTAAVRSALRKAETALQEHQSLDGYATQTWVKDQGYLTEHQDISGKQDTLVSGENIKTINGESILGSGNIVIEEGGTGDYEELDNLPSINNVELIGDKTASDLGLQSELTFDSKPTAGSANPVTSGGIYTSLDALVSDLSVRNNSLFGGVIENLQESPATIEDTRYYYITDLFGYFEAFDITIPKDGLVHIIQWDKRESVWDYKSVNVYSKGATDGLLAEKADKVSGAISGNLVALDSEGNITDSGYAPSDFATLDSGGKVPQSQLPSYVDDVLEYANLASFPATGESGKIYVALDTNKTYRWSGSAYVEISQSLALGETSSTAFPGDRGKAIEDKIPSNASSSNKLVADSDAVHKDSDETITGVKTFDNRVILGTGGGLGGGLVFEDIINDEDYGFIIQAGYDVTNQVPEIIFYGNYADEAVRLSNIAVPSRTQDAATKGYVDTALQDKLDAPSTAGTSGQVLTSDGQGGQSWQTPQSGGVTDVTVGGTSVVSGGVAAVPAIPDISGKADKVVYVDASTPPSTMDANKVYQYGTLSGNTTFPAFTAVSSGDTEVKIWCWTFTTPSTAPTITWPAGITAWNGGSAPTINASKNYEVSVMDGVACIIES